MSLVEEVLNQLPGDVFGGLQKCDRLLTSLRVNTAPIPQVVSQSNIHLETIDWDVVICGGTLGILIGCALVKRGLRVALLERGVLRGREQEWNISRSELEVFLELDLLSQQELVNAIDQTVRDIKSRYDLKDTQTTMELGDQVITINTDSEFTLDSVQTILREKAAKRNLSLKIFDFGKVDSASGNRVRQEIKLKRGISQEIAKQITKLIRDEFNKVQASIQGDAVRVSSKDKDDLQTVIQRLKQEELPVALQFTNYR